MSLTFLCPNVSSYAIDREDLLCRVVEYNAAKSGSRTYSGQGSGGVQAWEVLGSIYLERLAKALGNDGVRSIAHGLREHVEDAVPEEEHPFASHSHVLSLTICMKKIKRYRRLTEKTKMVDGLPWRSMLDELQNVVPASSGVHIEAVVTGLSPQYATTSDRYGLVPRALWTSFRCGVEMKEAPKLDPMGDSALAEDDTAELKSPEGSRAS